MFFLKRKRKKNILRGLESLVYQYQLKKISNYTWFYNM